MMDATPLIRSRGVPCTVKRPTSAADSIGASTPKYQDHLLGIRGFLQESRGSDFNLYGAERGRRTASWYVGPGHDIQSGDRVIINGQTWDINAPPVPRTIGTKVVYMVCELQLSEGVN